MKSAVIGLSFSALFFLGTSVASAQSSGIPELCDWYPGIPECSCNVNPYNVVCGLSGWGGTPDLRDGVVPPDPQVGVYHVPKQSGNPYYATCWSSSQDRFNYARHEILQSIYNGSEYDLAYRPWADTWFFVVYSDNTQSEGYIQSWLLPSEIGQERSMQTCGRPPISGQIP